MKTVETILMVLFIPIYLIYIFLLQNKEETFFEE